VAGGGSEVAGRWQAGRVVCSAGEPTQRWKVGNSHVGWQEAGRQQR